MPYKNILFDLDGTLLPIDMDSFLEQYLKKISSFFSGYFPPQDFLNALMKATDKMLKNDGKRLNCEVFKDCFFKLMDVDVPEDVMMKFDKFYREEFPELKGDISINKDLLEFICNLKKLDYRLIIATNPVFPGEAIEERLSWIGFKPNDFTLITNYENMHYCKPKLDYYREIMSYLDTTPEKCIMVGNDVQEDMTAGRLGIKTFLITDHLINRGEQKAAVDWSGSLEEFITSFTERL